MEYSYVMTDLIDDELWRFGPIVLAKMRSIAEMK